MNGLRDIEASDKDMLRRWRNLPEVRRYMYSSHLIGAEEHERWFGAIATDVTRRHWIIQYESRDVGLGTLYDISPVHQRCYFASYLADPAVRGKGIASAAEFHILNYAFNELGMRKVCCGVLEFNTPGVEVHTRLGFVEEGRLRQHVLSEGLPVDVICLGLLRQDWEAKREDIEKRLRARKVL